MKIYATQKLKDTDVQKMKDREELDRQKDKTDVKETSMVKNQSDTGVNAETSEPEYGYIEALF